MDQEALVKSGHLLLSYLDETNLKPKAAIWVHFTDTDTWRFWIVPANSNNTDKREFYFTVASKISENLEKLLGLDVSYIELVKETHPAIKGLSGMFKVTGLSTVHASANNFNGYFLPDGIILRMDL